MRGSRVIVACLTGLSLAACSPVDPSVKDTSISVVTETIGVGAMAKDGDHVTINYRIVTQEGREILSANGYGFTLGIGSVIEGIEDAVKGMRVTGERHILCPPHRHWGRDGYGDGAVPPNAILSIHVALQSID